MTKKKKELINNFLVAAAVVLIWRGIWHLLDMVDIYWLGGQQIYTAIGGMIVGILILYIPDKDLKELGKL